MSRVLTLNKLVVMLMFVIEQSFSDTNPPNCEHVRVKAGDSVMLDCISTASSGNYWSFKGDQIYRGRNVISSILGENAVLQNNYSLFINETQLIHQGSLLCTRNSTPLITYCLNVFVVEEASPTPLPATQLSVDVSRRNTDYSSEVEQTPDVTQRNEREAISIPLLPTLSGAAVIIVIVIAVSCFLARRKRQAGSRHQHTMTKERESALKLPEDTIQKKEEALKVETPDSPKYERTLQRSFLAETEVKQVEADRYQGPPKLELPQVPQANNAMGNSYSVNTEGVYYSDLKEYIGFGRLYNYQDLCIIMSLKVGKIHNRWMASISAPNEPTKCVFVSAVSDNILRTRELQWDAYVKRNLELPEMESLVKTDGICIDGAKLYLIQEHLTCVTMESHIHSTQQGTSVPNEYSSSDVNRWTVDILKGMEMIHSYGLLHPGLSNRKILFTDKKIPKLYDFCLAEDASHKVLLMKEKMVCSRNQLAPEALSRNEYSTASDVWSIAVVFWELLTGCLPFPSDIESTLNRPRQQEIEWPTQHEDIRNERVLDCWREDNSLRPSMRELRLSFEESVCFTKKRKISDDISTCDMYVPMNEIISTDSENKKSNSF